jgi:hypothetical protein
MADPGAAAQILLDLADRPILRVAGDHVRYRLAAAALLSQAGDLRAAEATIHDTLHRCGTLGSRSPGPAGSSWPGSGAGKVNRLRPRDWPTRGWPRSTAQAYGLSYPTPWKCWEGSR